MRILELQRAAAFRVGTRQPNSIVGGFAQLTTVTRREITTKIVCRWEEDRVGEKLGTRFTKLRRVFGFGAAA